MKCCSIDPVQFLVTLLAKAKPPTGKKIISASLELRRLPTDPCVKSEGITP